MSSMLRMFSDGGARAAHVPRMRPAVFPKFSKFCPVAGGLQFGLDPGPGLLPSAARSVPGQVAGCSWGAGFEGPRQGAGRERIDNQSFELFGPVGRRVDAVDDGPGEGRCRPVARLECAGKQQTEEQRKDQEHPQERPCKGACRSAPACFGACSLLVDAMVLVQGAGGPAGGRGVLGSMRLSSSSQPGIVDCATHDQACCGMRLSHSESTAIAGAGTSFLQHIAAVCLLHVIPTFFTDWETCGADQRAWRRGAPVAGSVAAVAEAIAAFGVEIFTAGPVTDGVVQVLKSLVVGKLGGPEAFA